jgi:hypothetical protein
VLGERGHAARQLGRVPRHLGRDWLVTWPLRDDVRLHDFGEVLSGNRKQKRLGLNINKIMMKEERKKKRGKMSQNQDKPKRKE